MSEKKYDFVSSFLDAVPVFLAFAIPVFFLPITSEFFEFNKLALLTGSTIAMIVFWIVKMIRSGKFIITRSSVDFPIILFLIVVFLATVFSIEKHASVFGAYGRWFPSLLGMAVLVAFYFIVSSNVSNIKTVNTSMYALIAGSTISTIVAVLGYFGISLWSTYYFQVKNFALTGSTTTAGILAVLGVIIPLALISSNENRVTKLILVATAGINLLGVILIGSFPGWVLLLIGFLTFAFFVPVERIVFNKTYYSMFSAIALAVVLLLAIPSTREVIVNDDYPSEIRLSPRESWIVVSSVIRDFPALGTGPSTFGLNFTRNKPLSINGKEYWDIRFDKPYSEAFAIVGSLGIIGAVVSIFFIYRFVRYIFGANKHAANEGVAASLAVGALVLLASFFFTYSTVLTGFVFVLFLAMFTAKGRLESEGGVEKVHLTISSLDMSSRTSLISGEKEVFHYIVAIPMAAFAVASGYFAFREYTSEFFMRKAITAFREDNGSLVYSMQQKVLGTNPGRDVYHSTYADTNLALATSLASGGGEFDEDTIRTLISQAIRSSRIATEVVNPLNASSWESRANIYRSLIGVADDADEWAIRSYNSVIQLDPVNPRLRLALGGVYYAAEDYLSAANMFSQSISLKSDYANAHYNLAQAFKNLERFQDAKRELELTQRLVEESTDDYNKVVAELGELERNPAVAGASDVTTVEDLEGDTADQEAQVLEQEPLSNVGEEETSDTTYGPSSEPEE